MAPLSCRSATGLRLDSRPLCSPANSCTAIAKLPKNGGVSGGVLALLQLASPVLAGFLGPGYEDTPSVSTGSAEIQASPRSPAAYGICQGRASSEIRGNPAAATAADGMVDGIAGRDGRYTVKFWRYTVAPFADRPTSIPMTAF